MTFSETARRDIEISTTGTVHLVNGDVAFVAGDDAIRQSIVFTLQLSQGEWFANTDAGIPWFTDILGAKFNLDQIRSIFREKISKVEGVQAITRLALDFDNAARRLSVEFTVETIFSANLNGAVVLDTVTGGTP